MVRPSIRSQSNVTRSILPPCSIHGMWGSRKTSCDGLAKKKTIVKGLGGGLSGHVASASGQSLNPVEGYSFNSLTLFEKI